MFMEKSSLSLVGSACLAHADGRFLEYIHKAMQPAGEFVAVLRDLFLDKAGQGIGVDRLGDHVAVALRPQRVKEFVLAARRGIGAGLGRQAEDVYKRQAL